MKMDALRDRTKKFALRIIRLCATLPKDSTSQVIGTQTLRSGTSVAANFREATRARSHNEFLAKLGIVEQELDETLLWLELLADSKIVPAARLAALTGEADELLRIIVASIRTAKKRSK
jgi:four helix bundle protein